MTKVDSSKHNFDFWQTEARTRKFRIMKGLQKPEKAIFDLFSDQLKIAFTLDLGVGCGRTSPVLNERSSKYLGTDYSQKMIDVCNELHPTIDFSVMDARNMQGIEDESVDFVVFSYNGIDCVGHDDRLAIFAEVRRVLKPSGRWIFSSHNRNFTELGEIRNPWNTRYLSGLINPLKAPKILGKYFIGIRAHARLKASQIENTDYAVLNEQTNRFRELMYYITPDSQLRQLKTAGFNTESMWNTEGQNSNPYTETCPWIYYVCSKA